jgi:hypothetical protein
MTQVRHTNQEFCWVTGNHHFSSLPQWTITIMWVWCYWGLFFLPHGESLPENEVKAEENKYKIWGGERIGRKKHIQKIILAMTFEPLGLITSDLSLGGQDICISELLIFAWTTLSWSYLCLSHPSCLDKFPKQIATVMSHAEHKLFLS